MGISRKWNCGTNLYGIGVCWFGCLQVFILLETIYGEFDKIAKRRKVFKGTGLYGICVALGRATSAGDPDNVPVSPPCTVETIGDCYLAVSQLEKWTTMSTAPCAALPRSSLDPSWLVCNPKVTGIPGKRMPVDHSVGIRA